MLPEEPNVIPQNAGAGIFAVSVVVTETNGEVSGGGLPAKSS